MEYARNREIEGAIGSAAAKEENCNRTEGEKMEGGDSDI